MVLLFSCDEEKLWEERDCACVSKNEELVLAGEGVTFRKVTPSPASTNSVFLETHAQSTM